MKLVFGFAITTTIQYKTQSKFVMRMQERSVEKVPFIFPIFEKQRLPGAGIPLCCGWTDCDDLADRGRSSHQMGNDDYERSLALFRLFCC